MKMYQVAYVLLVLPFVTGSLEAAKVDLKKDPLEFSEIKWNETSPSQDLTPRQVAALNLYLNFPSVPEVMNLSQETRQNLPLIVELHAEQLDPTALSRYRAYQQLEAGMSFHDVAVFRSIMVQLKNKELLDQDQEKFLKKFINEYYKNFPSLALIPVVRPLFAYARAHKEALNFSRVQKNALMAVGMTSREIRTVLEMAANGSDPSQDLEKEQVISLDKLSLLARVQSLDIFSPQEQVNLQKAILDHADELPPTAVLALNQEIRLNPETQNLEQSGAVFEMKSSKKQRKRGVWPMMPKASEKKTISYSDSAKASSKSGS